MAQKGMFGNQYQQAVTDETALRRQQSQTGGLTGWAAITNAMSGIGSEIGYQGGQAMGGMTPAQQQQASFQAVMDSVPNFNPMDPASLQTMSSAMWQAGFYDEGMAMMEKSQGITADNLNVELKELQINELRNPKPKEISIADQIASNKAIRIAEAAALVQGMPRQTSADMDAVSKVLEDAGYTDTPEYKNLRTNLTSTKGVELSTSRETQTNIEQAEKAEEIDMTLKYKPVLEVGKGVALVDGFFLNNAPVGLGTEDTQALSKQIGGLIETYDNQLSTDRGTVSPGEAASFYEKVLRMPSVYQANEENTMGLPIPFLEGTVDLPLFGETSADVFKGYKFDPETFRSTLDTVFGRDGKQINTSVQLEDFARRGLIIPNVTIINGGDGNIGVMTPQQLEIYLNQINSDVPTGN